jgi:hypothetical protein
VLHVEIPIRTVFESPTVSTLTRRWNEMATSSRIPLRRMSER